MHKNINWYELWKLIKRRHTDVEKYLSNPHGYKIVLRSYNFDTARLDELFIVKYGKINSIDF